LLEKPEKTNFLAICRDNNVQVELLRNKEHLIRCIKESDLVEIEWWHHPVMAGFLADFPALSTRIIFWSHISGTFYPYISADFIKFAGTMIFTSPYSFENQYWNDTEKVLIKKNCRMIYSSGGFERIEPVKRLHEGFNVGYIGTQSYAKLNPNFVEYCNAISDIPNIKFTMVGDLSNQYAILKEANKYHIASQMHFVDYVNSVSEEFSEMDVFGYLLNPTHFGTTENVLLEAMAAALPVVCLDQCTEKHLIRHNCTGLLVKNKDEYKNAINYLYNNPKEGRRLGKAARLWVNDNFSIVSTVEKLHTLYNQVIQMDKREYTFSSVLGQKPYQYFLSCLPPELKVGI